MNRAHPLYWLGLVFTVAVTLATLLQPHALTWSRSGQTDGVLKVMFGDGRRLFANHFYAQADISFHAGYYPSIFDVKEKPKASPMAAGGGEYSEAEHMQAMAKDQPRDWIEAFGRNFRITEHTHLENGKEREILPWLRLSAEMDPQRVETYTVAAYWLRKRLGKVAEAEQFLREGLRNNPASPEILYELGQLYYEDLKEPVRSRNLLELALKRWITQEAAKPKPDLVLYDQIVVRLAGIEENAGNFARAVEYLELAKKVSPKPDAVQQRIDEAKSKIKP